MKEDIRTCYIFGAGQAPKNPPEIGDKDLVIAADAGYLYTKEEDIEVDVLIGDFDSLEDIYSEVEDGVKIKWLPKEKDETDLLAAIKYGVKQGCNRFNIYGGTGGRIDHTFANIQSLMYLANQGLRGYLIDDNVVITVFRDELKLEARENGIISFFAVNGDATRVNVKGLKYPLRGALISCDFPIGVSNEFIGKEVSISVYIGTLLVVYPVGTKEIF